MTKKHFQRLAYELFGVRPDEADMETADSEALGRWLAWNDCVQAVATACMNTNPAFDAARFWDACLADSYTPSMHGR